MPPEGAGALASGGLRKRHGPVVRARPVLTPAARPLFTHTAQGGGRQLPGLCPDPPVAAPKLSSGADSAPRRQLGVAAGRL